MLSYRLCFLVAVILLGGCAADRYRSALTPKEKSKIISNPYGSYISVTTSSTLVAGELIAVNSDSVFVLTETDLQQFLIGDINHVAITLTENNTKKFLIMTGVAVSPAIIGAMAHSEYAIEFLALSIPAVLFGSLAIFAESQRDPHIIKFPSKDMADIRDAYIYARFPGGMPLAIDRSTIKPIL